MGNGDESDANGGEISTENTMRERAGENRLKLWILLGANRLLVTGVLSAAFFVLFILVGAFIYPPFRSTLARSDVIETMFSTMIGALITGTTLVVTISQLVISQENGPLGDQRERMSRTLDFRDYASELTGQTTPSDPSAFLRSLVDATESRARELNDSIDDQDGDLAAEMDEFTDSLIGNAETVKEQLDGATFGTFDVLFAALNYNYSWKMFHLERMRDEYGDRLDDRQKRLIEELRTAVTMFGPAREHIKTLYFQWALIDLSQLILYAAVPALLVAGCMLAFVGEGSFSGFTLGVSDVLWVVGGAFTVTLVPFFLFMAYILRVATVAKRTLAIGPLILRDSQR